MDLVFVGAKLGLYFSGTIISYGWYGVKRVIWGRPESELDIRFRQMTSELRLQQDDPNYRFYWQGQYPKNSWVLIRNMQLVKICMNQLEALEMIVDLRKSDPSDVGSFLLVQQGNESTMATI